jgi:hypothetical protein
MSRIAEAAATDAISSGGVRAGAGSVHPGDQR